MNEIKQHEKDENEEDEGAEKKNKNIVYIMEVLSI